MNKLFFFIFITLFCLTSAANTLSDCIADALDRLTSKELAYATHVYVECDNLPLDLLTREDKNFKFVSSYNKFLYNSHQMYSTNKDYAAEGVRTSHRKCKIEYELNKNIITITIIPYVIEYSNNTFWQGLWDSYTFKYKYDFDTKQWFLESQSSRGI